MAVRDLFAIIPKVPGMLIPSRYRPDPQYLSFMIRHAKTNEQVWEVIKWAMAYGYVMGHRATVNGAYQETPAKEYNRQAQEIQAYLKKKNIDAETLASLT